MVKEKILKTIIFSSLGVAFLLLGAFGTEFAHGVSEGITYQADTSFNVNINEMLSVNISYPDFWASGTINEFLTNKIGISVITNNPAGFVASMKSASSSPNLINLTDSSYVMPTISDVSVTINDATDSGDDFPANHWGYSVVNGSAAIPLTYYPMVGSGDYPIEVARSNVATNEIAKDIYFAAKTDGSVASGTYANKVIISIVPGVAPDPIDDPIDEPIIDPGEPIIPGPDIPIVSKSVNPQPGLMSVTTTTSSSYAKPAGVNDTTISNVNEGVPLAAGLAVAAGVSAAAGAIFFVVAKRRRKDEDDDDGTEDY